MTEAEKYEGPKHREKPAKNQKKGKNDSKHLVKANANGSHRQPYVEDGSDGDNLKSGMPPPPAPSPPPPGTEKSSAESSEKPVNVFDFLEPERTPNASKVSLGGPKESMQMVDHAPSVFEPSKALARLDTEAEDEDKQYDVPYEENGFSYGSGPIPPSSYAGKAPHSSTEFMTPAPKKKKDRSRAGKKGSPENDQANGTVSEKKRKRGTTEDVDMDDAVNDTPMMDAPSSVLNHPGTPMLNHSGLTGGLNKLLRSPSMEAEDQHNANGRRRYEDPTSPIKRTRRNDKEANSDAGLGISIKDRAGRFVSSMFGGSAISGSSGGSNDPSKATVRRRSSSDEGHRQLVEVRRPKKSTRGHNASNGHDVSGERESRKQKRKSSANAEGDRPSRRLKQIEYRRDSGRSRSRSPRRDDRRQMVVYREPTVPDEVQREMATHFLSLVTKGPESSRGLSINKTLKRFHRDFTDEYDDDDRGRAQGQSRADRERRGEDEKDLWRTLRLKRNDRGEVVVFF